VGAASAPLGWRPKVPLRVRLLRRPVRCWTMDGLRTEGRGALGGHASRAKRSPITRACGYTSALAGRSAQLVWASADIGRRRGPVSRAVAARATRPGRRRNWRQLSGLFGDRDRGSDAFVVPGPLGSAGQSQQLDQPHAPPVLRTVRGRKHAREATESSRTSTSVQLAPGCPRPDGELPPDAVSPRATLLVAVCVDAKGG
jgi:hypothetical protein